MTDIRVINIIENIDDSYGGPAKSVPYMSKCLIDLGIKSEIVSVRLKQNESNEIIERHRIPWTAFQSRFIAKVRYAPKMREYLLRATKTAQQIILHTQNLWNYPPYLTYKLHKKTCVPLVASIRGTLYQWSLLQKKLRKGIAWFCFQKEMLNSAECIHVTEVGEAEATRRNGVTAPIAIIPNGVDLEEFSKLPSYEKAKKAIGLKETKRYILFLSRLHRKKGLDLLVESWMRLATSNSDWDLLVVGPVSDEKYVRKIKKRILSNSLSDRVIFTGMLSGKKRLEAYAASDLFVLPSHSENFGITVLEALASGIPVITSTNTPWKEISSKNAGWCIDNHIEELTFTLKKAMIMPLRELEDRGSNGQKIASTYMWKTQSIKMKRLYEWILYGGKRPDFVEM